MKNPKLVVIGSSNTDMVIKGDKLPTKGETVCGGQFIMVPGGKGANQAVAAAKLGATAFFIGRVGKDIFGDASLENLRKEGVLTDFVVRDAETHSGVALILVDQRGENIIAVAPGSNAKLSPEDIDRAEDQIAQSDAVVLQLEIPMETVSRAIEIAKRHNVKVILNPAPARVVEDALLSKIDFLIPNEPEAKLLTGMDIRDLESCEAASQKLLEKGTKAVITTLGEKGALVVSQSISRHIPAAKVEPVDTTAAGDAFVGAFAVALTEGMDLIQAVKFANCAAALSTTKMGAQPSLPTREEVEEFVKNDID